MNINWILPPKLTLEEQEKERTKLNFRDQVAQCAESLEAIRILLANDLCRDARRLLDQFLLEVANTCLCLLGLGKASNINEAIEKIDETGVSGDYRAALMDFKSDLLKCLKADIQPHDNTGLMLATEKILVDLLKNIKKIHKLKIKADLRTAHDDFILRRNILIPFSLAFLLLGSRAASNLRTWWVLNHTGCKAVDDLIVIRSALEQYHKETGSYPSTSLRWDGKRTCWGESKEIWIDGLVPKYLAVLPSDPRNSDQCDLHYIYRSDGKDYKLISYKAVGFEPATTAVPNIKDPARYDHAFGFWTDAASSW